MNELFILLPFAVIPQTLLIFYASLGLVGAKKPLRTLIVPACLLAVIVISTRSFALLFGWHLIIFLTTYLVIARFFKLASFLGSLAAAALSFILTVLGDILLLAPFLALFGLTYEIASESTFIHVVMGWMESFPLVIASVLVKWRNFVLFPIEPVLTQSYEGDPPVES